MTPLRLGCWAATWAGVAALVACRASVPGAPPAGAPSARPVSRFAVTRYADSVPITALAFRPPYVWAGTERGLRRWKVDAARGASAAAGDADADAESIGAETGLLGHQVGALGVDEGGGAWVATESGIGRLAQVGPRLRYEARGTLTGITLLVPSRGDGGAWAGGAGGLFHFDGRSWTIVDFLRDVPVTSLDLDVDGRAAWVGTRGRGLYRVDEQGGQRIVAAADDAAAEEIIGTAPSEGGARVVATRAGQGNSQVSNGGRIIFLTKDGPEEYRTQPDAGVRFVRLVAAGANPILVAVSAGAVRLYTLRPLPRGQSPPTGGFRLVSTRKGSTVRYAATPMALAAPPDITVAAGSEDGPGAGPAAGAGAAAPEIWFGSRQMGVARPQAPRPRYLGGDLTEDAERFSVACTAADHCLVVAGGAHAWLFDGARFRETRVGETAEGRALAVVTDATGAVFGISAAPPWKVLTVTRRASGNAPGAGAVTGAGAAGDDWQVIEKIPLALGGGRPSVTFATFSPAGKLWLGLGAVAGDGQEQGRGALEIMLATHAVVRHGGVAGSAASANGESLPLPHDLTGVLFDGTATWFSSRSGISRWQESELRHWGENEHMDSEVCLGIARSTDGKIWAATSAGVGRFDGTEWRFSSDGDTATAARAVARDGAGRMWLATAKGLRVFSATEASAPSLGSGKLDVALGVGVGDGVGDGVDVDVEMFDLTLDRFGRVWVLGAASLAIVNTDTDAGVDVGINTAVNVDAGVVGR